MCVCVCSFSDCEFSSFLLWKMHNDNLMRIQKNHFHLDMYHSYVLWLSLSVFSHVVLSILCECYFWGPHDENINRSRTTKHYRTIKLLTPSSPVGSILSPCNLPQTSTMALWCVPCNTSASWALCAHTYCPNKTDSSLTARGIFAMAEF